MSDLESRSGSLTEQAQTDHARVERAHVDQAQPDQAQSEQAQTQVDDQPSPGPNLTLIYSLIALALVAAIGFPLLIVLPFYHRR